MINHNKNLSWTFGKDFVFHIFGCHLYVPYRVSKNYNFTDCFFFLLLSFSFSLREWQSRVSAWDQSISIKRDAKNFLIIGIPSQRHSMLWDCLKSIFKILSHFGNTSHLSFQMIETLSTSPWKVLPISWPNKILGL